MKLDIEYLITFFIIALMGYGFWLVPNGHPLIGSMLIGFSCLFILILLGRAHMNR